MRRVIDVLRRERADAKPYHQRFDYETSDERATVATALTELNERDELVDVDGNVAAPIRWESSCLQRRCGACAMVIQGVPRLACDTRLADLRGTVVRLEPLRKFEVVADLMVDRERMRKALRESLTWLEDEPALKDRRWRVATDASLCLQCGICLEVCPNYAPDGDFFGMAQMVPLTRLLAEAPASERSRLAASWRDHVFSGCAKSLACRDVCPAHLDLASLMGRSNGAVLWHLW